jgi:hypothetical protein
MAKSNWYAGKTVNPEFTDAARAHAKECSECGREPWGSEREHNAWRSVAADHVGAELPPTFLPEAPKPSNVNRNISRVQGNVKLDLEARQYD